MAKTPEVSVVVPVYGEFDLARACISVQSILSQQSINYEVIVSEQGVSRRFPKMSGVKHVFKYHKPQPDLSDFNNLSMPFKCIYPFFDSSLTYLFLTSSFSSILPFNHSGCFQSFPQSQLI